MKKYALIMAGGEGRRAGTESPKQFVKLLGIPMLWWSVMAFHAADRHTRIRLVMHPGFFADYDVMLSELPADIRNIDVDLCAGGRDRGESVKNGLMAVAADADTLVAVHDAARPLVTPEIISAAWQTAAQSGSAVPVWPVSDSLREVEPGKPSHAVDRSRFVAVQTPQVFRSDILHEAYELAHRPEFTDDASRVEALGHDICLFDGAPFNLKVTNPMDFEIATALLRKIKQIEK